MNHLADETSPYLLQHRDNPVDWYPWGEAAFRRARDEDRPILLSVGYSACHWCHVMAHETFEHEPTAELMNELFVNVKVDREERPDVDAIYMDAVQAIAGQGGWPMTVFLTPDGRPFFGGTYFPRARFADLLRQVAAAWSEQRDALEGDAQQLADAIRAGSRIAGPGPTGATPDPSLLPRGYDSLAQAYDPDWGGFGRAPKFPQPSMVEFVLRMANKGGAGAGPALAMVVHTLDAMAAGGIYDHLGGGFARYATERTWLIPHFEKMLYDNALLVRLYLHGWQVTGEDRYRQVIEETAAYLLRAPMRSPAGGIHSAEDADSEGVEGKFSVWSLDEVEAVGGAAAVDWYGVTRTGNWEGANILRRPPGAEWRRPPAVEAARARLFETRERRVRPGLDDKVVAEWNAMAAAALADAGVALGRPEWVGAAEEIAAFLLGALRRPDGRWLRSWQGGRPGGSLAVAVDYAWLVEAFTRLGEATGAARWITEARSVADDLLALFWDDEDGGLFTTGHDAERLIARAKDTYDGATPSANSVAAVALLRLGALTGEARYGEAGAGICRLLEPLVARQPMAFTNLLVAIDLLAGGFTEVAVTGDRADLVGAVQASYQPSAVLTWGEPYPSPLWEGRLGAAERGKAFVCRNYTCRAPILEPAALLEELARGPMSA
ncbi:MAG TPA: thioredoxin domain-containing protein [Acidimicrobiales bacterium]